ncbi:MAG: autoinducer binding domain-containing protein, partial [Boseongicola sp.]|nr:autoinducer binding domain-containing protein [Boseongicola sp.]
MLESFIERIQGVRTLDELNDYVVSLRDTLEVEHIVYHSVNSTGEQYAALTYSPEWVGRYLDQDYARIDPVVQACYRRFHPIEWKRLDWSPKSAKNFLGQAIDAGV